ncbi:MAG: hypothetical protein ACP5HU_00025 [Phycisphaerae bacterium]
MKNAKAYEPKIRKLLSQAKNIKSPAGDEDRNPVRVLLHAVLSSNATPRQAEEAAEALESEFVDYNELRVSPVKDLTDRLGKDYPQRRAKAEMLTAVLNAIFERTGAVSMDYMHEMSKRDLRRHLRELGLDAYAAAYVTLFAFGGHAIPVDEDLAESLKMEDAVHPESDVEDIQGFLERVIPQKDAEKAHAAFRDLVRRKASALTKKRREQAEAKAKAEAEAERQRLKKEQAEAEKQAAAEARKQQQKKKKAAAKKSGKKKTTRKKASSKKSSTKKSTKAAKAKKKKKSTGGRSSSRKKSKTAKKSGSKAKKTRKTTKSKKTKTKSSGKTRRTRSGKSKKK